MDLDTEPARLNAAPDLPEWVVGTVQKLIDEAQQEAAESIRQITRRDTELHTAQTRIQALMLELAHLRRMRFGASSEALSVEQRSLFEESSAADVAALRATLDAATAQLTPAPAPSPRTAPTGRKPLPDIYHASNTGMNRRAAPAASVGVSWSRSAKTSANNCIDGSR